MPVLQVWFRISLWLSQNKEKEEREREKKSHSIVCHEPHASSDGSSLSLGSVNSSASWSPADAAITYKTKTGNWFENARVNNFSQYIWPLSSQAISNTWSFDSLVICKFLYTYIKHFFQKMHTILLLILSLINSQVSWSIQTGGGLGCFYWSTVLNPRSQIYIQQIKAILSVESQTQWSILCVLMYQSNKSKNNTRQTKSVIRPWCSHSQPMALKSGWMGREQTNKIKKEQQN